MMHIVHVVCLAFLTIYRLYERLKQDIQIYTHIYTLIYICQNNSRNYQFVFIRFYGFVVKVLSPFSEGFSSSTSHALIPEP